MIPLAILGVIVFVALFCLFVYVLVEPLRRNR